MDQQCKDMIWSQFGAAIDALENAIRACPDDLWYGQNDDWSFWYRVSHTLFWLDFNLEASPDTFSPPEPFGLEELDPAGVIPDPPYSKEQLLSYLSYGRRKCRSMIEAMTAERAGQRYEMGRIDITIGELLLYNLRHVQHHAAQLNLILRKETDSAPGWTFTAK